MREWIGVAIVGAAVGCSSASNGPPAPTNCSPSQQTGTYLEHWMTVSGNCGDIPDGLVMFINGMPAIAQTTGALQSCTGSDALVSNGGCKIEQTVSCASGPLAGATVTRIVQQQTADGSKFTVEMTVSGPCSGTYNMTETRQ
jgi:hypothetical protein